MKKLRKVSKTEKIIYPLLATAVICIFILGLVAFAFSTVGGILLAKLMNLYQVRADDSRKEHEKSGSKRPYGRTGSYAGL